MATPGMRELLSIGKVWELAQPTRRPGRREPTTWWSSTPRDRTWRRHAAHAADVRRDRTRRADRHARRAADRDHVADREFTARGRRLHARGDARQRDAAAARRACARTRLELDAVVVNARYPHALRRGGGGAAAARAAATRPGRSQRASRTLVRRCRGRRGPARSSCAAASQAEQIGRLPTRSSCP